MGFQIFSRKKKPEVDLVLDIGTEAVKALLLEKKEKEISVLGKAREYYDQYSAFFSPYFEREIIKRTISKVIKDLERETKLKTSSLILTLPPDIFVSRIISQSLKRKGGLIGKKEKEEILEKVTREGKKKMSQIYGREKGLLPWDLQFLELNPENEPGNSKLAKKQEMVCQGVRILETKIDGYLVPDILNYGGRNLEFRILAHFLPRDYLISNFFPVSILEEMGFETLKIFHQVGGLISLNLEGTCPELGEGIFLDIGGELSQIFLAKNGNLEKISEFKTGGKEFSQILSERLGLQEPDARILKHRYSKRDLTEESRQRIREFFETVLKIWFKNLREKLKEMSSGIFPSEIFIFGGGSLLPEIEEILEQGDWGDISFSQPPKVKFLQPQGLNLSPQYVPALLSYYAQKNF
jgi:cell division ATPase FtsA